MTNARDNVLAIMVCIHDHSILNLNRCVFNAIKLIETNNMVSSLRDTGNVTINRCFPRVKYGEPRIKVTCTKIFPNCKS